MAIQHLHTDLFDRNSEGHVRAHSQFVDTARRKFAPTRIIHCSTSHNSAFNIGSYSDPEGNFEGNQLLGRSMSLSPLYVTLTNDLHVSTGTALHHGFPWLKHGNA